MIFHWIKNKFNTYRGNKSDLVMKQRNNIIELAIHALHEGKKVNVSILGNSMEPVMTAGDIITLIHFSENELSIGKIIAYYTPGKEYLTIHRVIEIDWDCRMLLERGDNCNSGNWIPFENVVAFAVSKNGKYLSLTGD